MLGLLKKKTNNFAWAATSGEKRSLEYLALHKRVSAVLKVCNNADTTVENVYIVKSVQKFDTAKKNRTSFSSRLPLRRHFAKLATFSVDPGVLISLYASDYHPYTILATGE